VAGAQAAPVHEPEAEFLCCGFEVADEDIVIPHRAAVFDALEDEVLRAVGLDELVGACCPSRPDGDAHGL